MSDSKLSLIFWFLVVPIFLAGSAFYIERTPYMFGLPTGAEGAIGHDDNRLLLLVEASDERLIRYVEDWKARENLKLPVSQRLSSCFQNTPGCDILYLKNQREIVSHTDTSEKPVVAVLMPLVSSPDGIRYKLVFGNNANRKDVEMLTKTFNSDGKYEHKAKAQDAKSVILPIMAIILMMAYPAFVVIPRTRKNKKSPIYVWMFKLKPWTLLASLQTNSSVLLMSLTIQSAVFLTATCFIWLTIFGTEGLLGAFTLLLAMFSILVFLVPGLVMLTTSLFTGRSLTQFAYLVLLSLSLKIDFSVSFAPDLVLLVFFISCAITTVNLLLSFLLELTLPYNYSYSLCPAYSLYSFGRKVADHRFDLFIGTKGRYEMESGFRYLFIGTKSLDDREKWLVDSAFPLHWLSLLDSVQPRKSIGYWCLNDIVVLLEIGHGTFAYYRDMLEADMHHEWSTLNDDQAYRNILVLLLTICHHSPKSKILLLDNPNKYLDSFFVVRLDKCLKMIPSQMTVVMRTDSISNMSFFMDDDKTKIALYDEPAVSKAQLIPMMSHALRLVVSVPPGSEERVIHYIQSHLPLAYLSEPAKPETSPPLESPTSLTFFVDEPSSLMAFVNENRSSDHWGASGIMDYRVDDLSMEESFHRITSQ